MEPGHAAEPGHTAEPTELIGRCTFPDPGTAVVCAVSGGADSLALLALAVHAGCDVTAIHVDHGLRDGSAEEANLVRAAAQRFGAAFQTRRVQLEDGPNLEARARAARYDVLPAGVCTGHTADDQAETVLLAMLRGSGLAGLAAMERGARRPLLALRRSETRALCSALGLSPIADPMNEDPRFGRVRVRHEVLPLLNDVAGRDVVPLLARNAAQSGDAIDALDAVVSAVDSTSVAELAQLPEALRRWALRRWLQRSTNAEHPVDAASIDRVMSVAAGVVRAAEVNGGWRVSRRRGRLFISAPASSGGVPLET